MDLAPIWSDFIDTIIRDNPAVETAVYKKITGIPFLYLTFHSLPEEKAAKVMIRKAAASVMKGRQLHCETVYVREDIRGYVYRHRFYVPQQKMFCCGNLCPDCIRFRPF
ncbi:hypothetical protein V1498_14955 [Peribacillus sp. SCS-26]|uniref:hypothetical protein n=1 Tax=Paraperibacillus marinus TaxID=3115295 RepID=UPI003905BF69